MEDLRDDNGTTGRNKDTKRFEVQDNAGHLKGSRQEGSIENNTEEHRKQEDTSEYNKLDDRGTVPGNEAS